MVFKDPYELPLKPKPYGSEPPWFPFRKPMFSYWPWRKEYKRRPDYWTEVGYKDISVERGYRVAKMVPIREHDEQWWNPEVEDGTSVGGPFGRDSRYHRNAAVKADQPGNLFEFQKKLMLNSAQYKQIAEKWNISKEHPGIPVNPNLDSLKYYDKYTLGKLEWMPNLYHYGPRFFDKPMNEGCFEKGLALCKYISVATLVYSLSEMKQDPTLKRTQFRLRNFMREFVPRLPHANLLAFTFGLGTCTAAKIRHVDDSYNWIIAAGATSIMHKLRSNNTVQSWSIFFALSALMSFIQYNRVCWYGLSGILQHQEMGGLHMSGPLAWKFKQLGDIKIPTDKY